MANNRPRRDSYIIFGIDNECFSVIGVENDVNRRNQQGITNILRNITFAGSVRPRIEMRTIYIDNHEVDVLIIKDSFDVPYYLEKEYQDKDVKNNDGKKAEDNPKTSDINLALILGMIALGGAGAFVSYKKKNSKANN